MNNIKIVITGEPKSGKTTITHKIYMLLKAYKFNVGINDPDLNKKGEKELKNRKLIEKVNVDLGIISKTANVEISTKAIKSTKVTKGKK